MSMQHLETEFRKQGKDNLADIIASVHKLNGSDIPFPAVVTPVEKPAVKTPEIQAIKLYPEISLTEEWSRQAQNLARLFAKELKFKIPEEYIATLPKFEPQPKDWKGRLDAPVIVETRISPSRQAELAGIQYALDGLNKTDWNQNLKGYITPTAPYAAWLDDGRNHMNEKVEDVRSNLESDEIAGTDFDGIALHIPNPRILKHHFLDLPGTAVGSDCAVFLDLWGGRPKLSYDFVGHAGPGFGSVVRGRQK
ncbi:MAG: hypothetical protein AAB662_00685 [Patescibacteria group bacterium]